MKTKKISRLIALAVAIVLIVIDQVIKNAIVAKFERVGESTNLIKIGDSEILNLTYHLNDGAAFGFFGGSKIFLIVIVFAVLLGMIYYMMSGRLVGRWHIIAATLVIAGGGGNLIDRIFNDGKVVDYINFEFINFAIFNFADICAVLGCFGLFLLIVLDDVMNIKRKKQIAAESAENVTDISQNDENLAIDNGNNSSEIDSYNKD